MDHPYRIEHTSTFERDLEKLDREVARRILKKIDWMSEHPELLTQALKKMKPDLHGLQKYRVGDFRVLFWVDHSERVITLYAVGHRSSIYKNP